MEIVVISMLRKPLRDEFGIGDMEFAILGSVIFAGLLIGNLFGGLLADRYNPHSSPFDVLRTPIFEHRKISFTMATSAEILLLCIS
jgi:MFS family permease